MFSISSEVKHAVEEITVVVRVLLVMLVLSVASVVMVLVVMVLVTVLVVRLEFGHLVLGVVESFDKETPDINVERILHLAHHRSNGTVLSK
jgi:membrane-anchored glycerophosphoryl diester phosphodiesterase (GDPDase)